MSETVYTFKGLTAFDKIELRQQDKTLKFEELPVSDGAFGELATLFVTATVASLSIIAAYLLRKHGEESFTEEFEEKRADGTIIKRKIKYKKSNSEAPAKDILSQITNTMDGAINDLQ